MKLALFNDQRLGVVDGDGIVDVSAALPWPHGSDALTAGWWRRLCRDFETVRDRLREASADGERRALDEVVLRPAVLNPSKVIAAASNYADHVSEMHGVQERTLGHVEPWMMNFDVFLKAPSSISGPADDIVLPADVLKAGHEIHHESELVLVVGRGGKDIPANSALDHIFGYALGLDITVRSDGDRSRRKSYDTFSPIGPWVTTADEAGDPSTFEIELTVDGAQRQHVFTSDLLTPVPQIVAYASSIMTLLPGDVIFTGAPPGVGPIEPGDELHARISRIGSMRLAVRS